MRPWLKSLWSFVRYCADCVLLLACWTLWIALAGLLAVQVGIAVSREFAVPAFVLRTLEERFTASNVNARFGRATFNPTGGVLLEHVTFSLPEFNEPVVSARAVFVQLDPWLLLTGRLDARQVNATGITLSVPAMFAPTGRNQEMLRDLDFAITPGFQKLDLNYLTARIAGVAVELHGSVSPPPRRSTGPIAPLPLIENLARHYAVFCRQLIRTAAELAAFDQPALQATLSPSTAHGAIANVHLTAREMKRPEFRGIHAQDLSLRFDVPLLGDVTVPSTVRFTAGHVRATDGSLASGIQAKVLGSINPAHFFFTAREVELTMDEVSSRGFAVQSLFAQLESPAPLDWTGTIIADSANSPIAVSGFANFGELTADLRVEGALAPALLDPLGAQLGRDIRKVVDFSEPVGLNLGVTFKAGWKFEKLAGHIAARGIHGQRVQLDSATGEIEFDGRHFIARHAAARLGANHAQGSFEQDLSTLEFRFLLEGRLRPLDIQGWFGPWWEKFFEHFEFPAAPPSSSVDVSGRWRRGSETTVFVFAESTAPIIRGTPLDYGRTLMFIRPNFFDGLEFFGTRGIGDVRGTFTRHIDLAAREWTEMTFDVVSSIDLATGAGLLGPSLASQFAPFTFANAPQVKATGRLLGPASPQGEHQSMKIEAQSAGAFSLYDFPARNLSFRATIDDNVLTLEQVEAEVASGHLTGRVRLWGPPPERKLGFDIAVDAAMLSEAVHTVSNYMAQRRGEPPSAENKFLPGKSNVKLDLALSAEGPFDDLLNYRGSGHAILQGAELGEVRLLGLLSDLLNFTSLRFTTARLNFDLQGSKIIVPGVSVTGANSAIEGHGDYRLDLDEMNFNARVYPFQESKTFVQSMVGAVLTPLSTVLEVKLTGPLKQPSWAFVIGPTNFFRSLTQPTKAEPQIPPASGPSPYLKR